MKKLMLCWLGTLCFCSVLLAQDNTIDEKKLREIVLQDARKQGLDKTSEMKAALRAAEEALLVRLWEQKVIASRPVSPDMKATVYKDLSELLGDKEYRLFHVFLNDQKAARSLIAKMQETTDWNQLDPKTLWGPEVRFSISRTEWINMSAVQTDYRSAVRGLNKGGVTPEPVKAKDGWHVVGLVDVRSFTMPPPERIEKEINLIAERKIIESRLQEILQSPKQ